VTNSFEKINRIGKVWFTSKPGAIEKLALNWGRFDRDKAKFRDMGFCHVS
jgi:hypothetical protein